MTGPLLVSFLGGEHGAWRVERVETIAGERLDVVASVSVVEGNFSPAMIAASWTLRGVTSHHRYTERAELDALRAVQAGLGRPEATRAALIPIRKNNAWWQLPQDERRAIFEARSRHISGTMKF